MQLLAEDACCPCGRLDAKQQPLRYGYCCGQWLESSCPAPDAHLLMRSRYTAFVLERGKYLLQTWHASTRPVDVTFDAGTKWLGLQVRAYRQIDETHAQVEFVARQRLAGRRALRLHECSRFVRESGVWYYLDGDHAD